MQHLAGLGQCNVLSKSDFEIYCFSEELLPSTSEIHTPYGRRKKSLGTSCLPHRGLVSLNVVFFELLG